MVAMSPDDGSDEKIASALGHAVIQCWSELPQETQQRLFERAVIAGHHGEQDESLREQLAEFLHERHARTAPKPATVETPSG
jgi:hypothetical protein